MKRSLLLSSAVLVTMGLFVMTCGGCTSQSYTRTETEVDPSSGKPTRLIRTETGNTALLQESGDMSTTTMTPHASLSGPGNSPEGQAAATTAKVEALAWVACIVIGGALLIAKAWLSFLPASLGLGVIGIGVMLKFMSSIHPAVYTVIGIVVLGGLAVNLWPKIKPRLLSLKSSGSDS